MLDFWATWCGPCRVTMPELEKLQQEHPDDFVLLAINLGDDEEEIKAFMESRRLQTRVLLDSDNRVGQSYGASSIPCNSLSIKTASSGTARSVPIKAGLTIFGTKLRN